MWDLTSFNETFVLWDVSISPFVLINKSTQLNIRIKDVPLIVHPGMKRNFFLRKIPEILLTVTLARSARFRLTCEPLPAL